MGEGESVVDVWAGAASPFAVEERPRRAENQPEVERVVVATVGCRACRAIRDIRCGVKGILAVAFAPETVDVVEMSGRAVEEVKDVDLGRA